MGELIRTGAAFPPMQMSDPGEGNGYPPGPIEQSEVVKHYLHVLRRRKWLIAAVTATVLAAAAVQSYTTTPLYTASAQIQIDLETPNILPYQDVSQTPAFYYKETYQQTQHRILQSKILALRVVRKLNLAEDPAFLQKASPGVLRKIVPMVVGTVTSLLPSRNRASELKDEPAATAPKENDYAAVLAGGITVTPDKGTRLVTVSYSSPDPVLASKIVNTLAEEYIEHNFETRFRAATMATDFLQKELARISHNPNARRAN